MRETGDNRYRLRVGGLIVVLWRTGLPIGQTPALSQTILSPAAAAPGRAIEKGGKHRQVGIDAWAWAQLRPRQSSPRSAGWAALLA